MARSKATRRRTAPANSVDSVVDDVVSSGGVAVDTTILDAGDVDMPPVADVANETIESGGSGIVISSDSLVGAIEIDPMDQSLFEGSEDGDVDESDVSASKSLDADSNNDSAVGTDSGPGDSSFQSASTTASAPAGAPSSAAPTLAATVEEAPSKSASKPGFFESVTMISEQVGRAVEKDTAGVIDPAVVSRRSGCGRVLYLPL